MDYEDYYDYSEYYGYESGAYDLDEVNFKDFLKTLKNVTLSDACKNGCIDKYNSTESVHMAFYDALMNDEACS